MMPPFLGVKHLNTKARSRGIFVGSSLSSLKNEAATGLQGFGQPRVQDLLPGQRLAFRLRPKRATPKAEGAPGLFSREAPWFWGGVKGKPREAPETVFFGSARKKGSLFS